MTRQARLLVNNQPIELDYFVLGFVDHTVGGMLAALKGTGEIKKADISIEGDKVTVNLNGAVVSTSLFVSKILKSTITGMVSTLKGVGEINKVDITIER